MNLKELAELSPQDRALLYERMRDDYSVFAKVCMGHLIKEIPPYQEQIYKILNHHYEKAGFVLFRGAGKSTISKVVQVVADIVFGRAEYILLVSETNTQAQADLREVKTELMHNNVIKALFGDFVPNTNDPNARWNQSEIQTTNRQYVRAIGAGTASRGAKYEHSRPVKIILDDFESKNNSNTAAKRAALKSWLYEVISPMGIPEKTEFQYWGTIVNKGAYLNRISSLEEFNDKHGSFLQVDVEHDGVPAWESRFPMRWIEREKRRAIENGTLGAFLQEYYNIPQEDANPIFDPSKIILLPYELQNNGNISYLLDRNANKKILCNLFIGVDPAISMNDNADDTVICVIAALPDETYCIVDMFSGRLDVLQQVNLISKFICKYKVKRTTIESNAYQAALITLVKDNLTKFGHRHYGSILNYNTSTSKKKKWLSGLQPIVNLGKIGYIKNASTEVNKLKNQMNSFNEETRDHDDTIDGVFLSITNAYFPSNIDVDTLIDKQIKKEKNTRANPFNWFLN